ncbi:ABC transporter ATP-binding protein [Yoonia sediminilitoris]|uniref:ABC-2 type transport system ATP-binding protein n=1 Tax=Yoonia sediminilitoris TaxID=1286148 RepID=A0A2T6KK78_9RHOB|nr:ABC transporter ATP-binding protein [Yoonia sediminilitoris]PUB16332.1 ABC-2 type transport system ATP-binding protein [Yoonia sediminilitoris]RCW96681.1 ABC-2 type transport system ATP-binding protein [Yoonia sediminilitoris]
MNGISVKNLSYDYGGKPALNNVSFEIEAGSFCALLGPNGAGKSTLFNLLTRLFVPPQGQIEIAGHNLHTDPRAALAQLGIVFQQTTLDLDLTVYQNLSYFAALHGISGRQRSVRIEEVLDRLDIADRAKQKARTLNGGHRRRTEIARALLHKPAVLLLDEATVGLDAAARASITDHVHGLTDDGTTILWATHLADEVRPDDRLIVLHQAEILADGFARDLQKDTSLQEAFLAMTRANA